MGNVFRFRLGSSFHFIFHLALRDFRFTFWRKSIGLIGYPLNQLIKSVNHRAQLTFHAKPFILGHQLTALSRNYCADIKLLHWRLILSTYGKAILIIRLMMMMSLLWKRSLSVNCDKRRIFRSQDKWRRRLILYWAIAGAKIIIIIHNQALGSILLDRQILLVLKLLRRQR